MKATKKQLLDGLNVFTRSFISCGLELCDYRIDHKSIWDINRKSLEKIIIECDNFLVEAAPFLDLKDRELMDRAGYDFWLTRGHEGTGFWDREDVYGKSQAKLLTKISYKFIECDFFRNSGSRWVGWEAM